MLDAPKGERGYGRHWRKGVERVGVGGIPEIGGFGVLENVFEVGGLHCSEMIVNDERG